MEPLVSPTPEQEQALLQPLAARLIWWQSPRQSLRRPDRVIAQAMELGDFDSVLHLRQVLGDRRLAAVPRRAQPGWFSPAQGIDAIHSTSAIPWKSLSMVCSLAC